MRGHEAKKPSNVCIIVQQIVIILGPSKSAHYLSIDNQFCRPPVPWRCFRSWPQSNTCAARRYRPSVRHRTRPCEYCPRHPHHPTVRQTLLRRRLYPATKNDTIMKRPLALVLLSLLSADACFARHPSKHSESLFLTKCHPTFVVLEAVQSESSH
jgi:hypothetical protein